MRGAAIKNATGSAGVVYQKHLLFHAVVVTSTTPIYVWQVKRTHHRKGSYAHHILPALSLGTPWTMIRLVT